MQRPGAFILDFDGVIADSEALANQVLAEALTRLGFPTTLNEALSRYSGRRWAEAIAAIESDLGAPLPPAFSDELKLQTLERFRTELAEVAGAGAFIRRHSGRPFAIASSSSSDRLQLCLELLGLRQEFKNRVFSAELVSRGKPHPDIFLLAAERLGVPPAQCLVIEDSPLGVEAGVAAEMTVIGLCAGAHIRSGHDQRLMQAGASGVAFSWTQAEDLIATLYGVTSGPDGDDLDGLA